MIRPEERDEVAEGGDWGARDLNSRLAAASSALTRSNSVEDGVDGLK